LQDIKQYCEEENISLEDFFKNNLNLEVYISQTKQATNLALQSAVSIFAENSSGAYAGSGVIYRMDDDFSYISKNKLKFYKPGRYLIPAKFMWYRFDSGISDGTEIDMPSDIFLTIPLYIASVCHQIDNIQKGQLMRQEFELALSRCTAGDFMPLNKLESLL
jgi:hypothetical protein